MDHMEFSIALPPYVEMTGAGMEWAAMKQRLNAHVNHSSDSYQQHIQGLVKAFLINIAAEQVQQVFNMCGLSYDEAVKFNRVLQRLEDVCLPRFLIIYNRYKFFTCKQNSSDKFDDFLNALLTWSENCEFGDLKDILLKDCIITGITDDSVRQSLLKTEELDFAKTLEICRAVEQQQRLRNALVNTDQKLLRDACVDTQDFEKSVYKKDLLAEPPPLFCDASTNTDNPVEEIVASRCLDYDGDDLEHSVSHEIEADDSSSSINLKASSILHSEFESSLKSSKRCSKIKSIQTEPNNVVCGKEENKSELTLRRSKRGKLTLCSKSESGDENEERQPNGVSKYVGKKKKQLVKDVVRGKKRKNSTDHVVKKEKRKNSTDHVVKKEEEEDFLCSKCGQSFASHSTMISHLQDAHGQTQSRRFSLKCRVCKVVFPDLITLRKHRLKHKGEKRFKCETCSASFSNPSHLKVHIRVHTGERPFTCDTCGASFPEASKLKSHQRKHTGEKPYTCSTCQRTFAWTAAYTRHLRTHTGERPYTCEFCGGTFADFTSLQRHRRTHTKEKPYECETCEAKFTDPSALKLHKRIHTGERPYSCGACGTSFARSQHLKEHMKLHTGEKPFECETCGARFIEASKLKSHRRKHTGEKPYLCKICGASFAWTAAYTRHMRTHTLEKPYFCDFCGSRYADHSTLTRHRRTHTGERPYTCKVCSANFADNSSLHRHMRIHTGEKSYTCEVCGSSFAVKCYLLRHMRTHTGEKPYKCETCNSKFTDSSKLNRHKKIHVKARTKQEKQLAQQQQEEQQQQQEEQQYEQLQPLQQLLQQDQHLQHETFQIHQQFQPELTAEHQSMTLVQDLQHPLMVSTDLIPLGNALPFSTDMIS